MASSKNLCLLLTLLFALALLLSSHVAASGENKKTDAVEEAEYEKASNKGNEVTDAGGCRHGCCRWFNHRCVRCCATANEVSVTEFDENDQVGRCRHGCCRWFNHRCVRCCATASEVPVAEVEENDQAGRCRHGCCRWYNHRCVRCC